MLWQVVLSEAGETCDWRCKRLQHSPTANVMMKLEYDAFLVSCTRRSKQLPRPTKVWIYLDKVVPDVSVRCGERNTRVVAQGRFVRDAALEHLRGLEQDHQVVASNAGLVD